VVATLLSLKLRLTLADLKRSTARLVVWIIMGLYALSLVVMGVIGLAAASMAVPGHEAQAAAITVVAGAVLVIGWALLPLVFFGSDQTLDPARFTQFSLGGSQLAPGLVLAGVVGLPGLFTAILALASALPWLGDPIAVVFGLVGGVLGWATTQVGCRVLSAGLSGILSSRKAKDMSGLIGLILVLLLSTVGYGFSVVMAIFSSGQQSLSAVWATLTSAADVLSWTPLGAPWAIVGDAGRGQWLMLACHVVLSFVYLGVGLWLYARVLDKALVTPPVAAGSATVTKGDLIARVAGWSWTQGAMAPVAAIMARCLKYWRRDPRYLGTIPAVVFMPLLFTAMSRVMTMPGLSQNEPVPAFVGVGMTASGLALMAVMCGFSLSADLAYDASAWWLHLAAGVRGWQDRAGRVFALCVWAVPLIVVVGIAVPVVVGASARIPATLGAMLSLYGAGVAVSSVFSALIIYPVPLPGESPMKMKTGMMGTQMLSQFGTMIGGVVLGLPVCLWAIVAHGVQGWMVLVVGAVWGCALAVAGVVIGGRVVDSRGVTILASLMKNDTRERG
jgi:ABC-2 type transport system permease protein